MKKMSVYGFMAIALILFTFANFTGREAVAQAVKAALVRDVDLPARHPFQQEFNFAAQGPVAVSIPEGKRLVVECVSGTLLRQSERPAVVLRSILNGSTARHLVPLEVSSTYTESGPGYATSHLVRIYMDPGSDVYTTAFTYAGIGELDGYLPGHVTLSGYLIDIP
jgi:hypothetical protein